MENEFSIIMGDKNLSSWSLRAWLMLKQVNVEFTEHIVKLYTTETRTEILKYSPSGKVPALIHNGNVIWDSLAIGEYLNELFPEAQLWPQDRDTRAYARSISNEMHSGFVNLRKMMPFRLNESKELPISDELASDIVQIENIWLDCCSKYSGSGQYLFNKFTIADAMFAPIVLRFKTYNYIPKNPVIHDYCETILNNSFIKEWIAIQS